MLFKSYVIYEAISSIFLMSITHPIPGRAVSQSGHLFSISTSNQLNPHRYSPGAPPAKLGHTKSRSPRRPLLLFAFLLFCGLEAEQSLCDVFDMWPFCDINRHRSLAPPAAPSSFFLFCSLRPPRVLLRLSNTDTYFNLILTRTLTGVVAAGGVIR